MCRQTVAILAPNIVFFFFSSRRRHTRLQGDWSSDVCSSDLVGKSLSEWTATSTRRSSSATSSSFVKAPCPPMVERSEERRVGKECRSRRARKHKKKKTQAARKNVKATRAESVTDTEARESEE